jgi:DNA-binding IclR family transcriptional regulator
MSSISTTSTDDLGPDGPNGARRFGSDGDGSPAPAVTRAAAILDALEAAGGEPLGVSDLARSLGIAKSSTSHLCQALEDARLIQRRENGYVLGRRTIELAGAYLAGFDEVRSFYELCARTAALRQHVVQIAMLDGIDVLYLARYEGRSHFRMAANIGERFPAALTATGQALLAALPPAEVTRRFRCVDIPHLTESSLSGLSALQGRLSKTRRDGYAFDDEGVHPGVIGMAVRLTPRQAGGAMLSLGVTVLKSLATEATLAELLAELKSLATALSNPLIFG